MTDATTSARWALEEFGSAKLGDRRRERTLQRVARLAADGPGGCISRVSRNGAELEAAYRFVRNGRVDAAEIVAAAGRAAARRVAGNQFVFVPVDGTSLNLADRNACRGVGRIGDPSKGATGLQVITAMVVEPDGKPAGLAAQHIYRRPLVRKGRKARCRERAFSDKETAHWCRLMEQTQQRFCEVGSTTQPWFQLDRFGDFREMMSVLASGSHLVTVRAGRVRKVMDEQESYLHQTVDNAPELGRYRLYVPATTQRTARHATMVLRSKHVTLRLPKTLEHPVEHVSVNAVLAEEVGPLPRDVTRLRWLLLTNFPVEDFEQCQLVVYGYSRRWAIEEFHRAWKSTTRVEDNQLQGDNIIRWATILASVAMRAERIKHLDRSTPDAPATDEFSRDEVDAMIMLGKPKGFAPGDTPTMRQMITWIAVYGGYTGRRPSRGPPGTATIQRGLDRLEPAAQLLRAQREAAQKK